MESSCQTAPATCGHAIEVGGGDVEEHQVQRQALGLEAVVASIPFGVLVALVLFANNIRDIAQDTRAGIRTLGTVLGHDRALTGFVLVMASAYVYVLAAVAAGAFSPWMLLVFLSAPTAVSLVRTFRRAVPDAADAMTAKLDTVCVSLAATARK